MGFHVRVCRECGEEYRPDIVRCADCGGELEDVYDEEETGPRTRVETAPPPAPDLSDHRVIFETTRALDLVPLAERLREDEVPFRLAEKAPAGEGVPVQFLLAVPEASARAALQTLAPLLGMGGEGEDLHAVETAYEAGRGYVRCPACGTETVGAAECPECGLGLGGEAPACARCGAPLPDAGAECTVCGGAPPVG
jgi:hypothetical protein